MALTFETETERLRRSNRDLYEALMQSRQLLLKTERQLELANRMARAAND